ncbi:hypothetical protein HPB50_014348 [Hyalomma asiaticum]|uniref:Uncharacterized protein n=1 Tax=Hyalomma asiaticum TaxID=266040 RepID=A0ACB7SHS5_HYAAI|nr:hypothetical protein HPB50_014348 [Hyalomma asiaticum]
MVAFDRSITVNQRYNLNRTNNQLLRADLPVAKTVQRTEEEEAEFIRRTYEEMLRQQEEHDAKVALELQQQLQREAALHAAAQEEDQRLAAELQKRELPKKLDRIERRRRGGQFLAPSTLWSSLTWAHRDIYGIQSPEECYRVAIYVPYLDSFTASLARRFSESNERSFKLLHLHPSKMKHLSRVEFAALAEEPQWYYGIDNFKEEAISWYEVWCNKTGDSSEITCCELLCQAKTFFSSVAKAIGFASYYLYGRAVIQYNEKSENLAVLNDGKQQAFV